MARHFNPNALTPLTCAASRFEGIVQAYVRGKTGVTRNSIDGAIRFAIRWGASEDQLRHRFVQGTAPVWNPVSARVEEVKRVLDLALESAKRK
jgi:hypothetical protein